MPTPVHRPPADLRRIIDNWRRSPTDKVACPACGHELIITDRSARPYAEWYDLTCAVCGNTETLHIPLAGPAPY